MAEDPKARRERLLLANTVIYDEEVEDAVRLKAGACMAFDAGIALGVEFAGVGLDAMPGDVDDFEKRAADLAANPVVNPDTEHSLFVDCFRAGWTMLLEDVGVEY